MNDNTAFPWPHAAPAREFPHRFGGVPAPDDTRELFCSRLRLSATRHIEVGGYSNATVCIATRRGDWLDEMVLTPAQAREVAAGLVAAAERAETCKAGER